MRVAIIGSRGITEIPNMDELIPPEATVIVSGGARGVDTLARQYARRKGLEMLEFLPEYEKYGRGAPLKRNITIIENADLVIAFWDGKSRGTRFVIESAGKWALRIG